ncbi:hypothetical protein ORJ66_21190 [Pseudoalteromonas tunicata]|nr:hypothetical protein [Pseudoalteromonas tunicata]MDP5215562.1 hypothetical protein [Pseudoalteromonas tunicata]
MHCLVRDYRLESDTGGQKNGQIYKNRNSTASLAGVRGFNGFSQ